MRTLWGLLLLLPLVASAQGQTASPSDAFKQKFAPDEQWLLAVVLSDDKQKAAFDAESAAAVKAPPPDQDVFMLRWRKKVAGVASEYKKMLDGNIVPNAPSVEKMISENEFNLTNYWLMYQPPDRQKQILSDIKLGNAVLFFRRGDVEAKIRENRKAAAAGIGQYLATPLVVASVAYQEPAPKPSKAIDELKDANDKAQQAKHAPTPEKAADKADQNFSGKKNPPGEATPATETAPSTAASKPSLSPSTPNITGGLAFKPPPTPMLDREKPAKGSMAGVLAKKLGPAVGGGLLGGILGFLLGGPIGAVFGAIIGAAVGHKLGKAFLK